LRILVTVLVISLIVFISTTRQVANDFWLQAKIGELIAQTHSIPATVLFPFTEIQSAPFNAHEWLASLAFYGLLQAMDEDQLAFVNGLLGLALFFLTIWMAYRRSRGAFSWSLMLGFFAIVAENYRHTLRPELLSLLLLLVCLIVLDDLQKRLTWWGITSYLVTTIVWTNVHGSFVLAPLLTALCGVSYFVETLVQTNQRSRTWRLTQQFALLTVATGVATLLNPFGVGIWEFVVGFVGASEAKNEIIEWIPTYDPRIWVVTGVWIGLTISLIGLVWMWYQRDQTSWPDKLIFLMFLALGMKTNRFLVYAGIAMAYSISPALGQRRFSETRGYQITGAMVLVAAVWVWKFGNASGMHPHSTPDPTQFSIALIKTLANQELRGNVLNSYNLGAELIYRTYPRLRPSIDSRIDSYGDAYFYNHENMYQDAILLNDFIRRHHVSYLLLNRSDLETLIKAQKETLLGWDILLFDEKSILLRRRNS
jgi:hypothetical protein